MPCSATIIAKAKIFRGTPEITDSIDWLNSGNKSEFNTRMWDFARVNDTLELVMSSNEMIPKEWRDVRKLQTLLGGTPIPSLERIRSDFYNSPEVKAYIKGLFAKARETYPTWAKVNIDYPM